MGGALRVMGGAWRVIGEGWRVMGGAWRVMGGAWRVKTEGKEYVFLFYSGRSPLAFRHGQLQSFFQRFPEAGYHSADSIGCCQKGIQLRFVEESYSLAQQKMRLQFRQ